MESFKRSSVKALAFYGTLTFTPIPDLLGIAPMDTVMTAVMWGIVDVARRSFVDPQLPQGWADWAHDSVLPGGNWGDVSVIWDNVRMAALCKSCFVQAVLFWGLMTMYGNPDALGLAATGFVSTAILDLIMGFSGYHA
jgi:hypothetical protein